MNHITLIRNKLKYIYSSPLSYLMILLLILFLIIYTKINNFNSILQHLDILKSDIFLWLLFIPITIAIHKISIFTTYYNCLSRIKSRKLMLIVDYAVIIISTIIITLAITIVPIVLICLLDHTFYTTIHNEVIINILFLIFRYTTIGIFIQSITHTIMFSFPKLQKYSNSIYAIPIILFFILTFPLEFLRANSGYIAALDFSAGKNYIFIHNNIVHWNAIIMQNLHLIVYTAIYIWFSIDYISNKMEFIEDENNNTN